MEVNINNIKEQGLQVDTIGWEYKKYAYCPVNNGNTLQTFAEERVVAMVTFLQGNKSEIFESSKKALNISEVENILDQDVKAKNKFKR